MKTIILLTLFTLAIGTAHADKVEDVSVQDLKYGKNSFEVKLQIKGAKKDQYFLVDIVKEDEKALEKVALVLKKMKLKNSFKLNLNIPSFSPSPSGSYYRSNDVTIEGSAEGESFIK